MNEKSKERILILTDVPLCTNYSGGIMTCQLSRFLLEEKHELFAFIPWNKCLKPKWDESVISDVNIHSYERPTERFLSEYEKIKYKNEVRFLQKELLYFIKESQITKVWCIIQGDLICSLINFVYNNIEIDYVVQIWDPIEWWIKDNEFSKKRELDTLKKFKKALKNSKLCITTSKAMSEYYNEKYNVACEVVMPSIKQINLKQSKKNNKTFSIAISGQIYAKEEMENFINALDTLQWKINDKHVYLHHFGEWDNKYIDIKKHEKYKNRIFIEGFFQQDELVEKLQDMDLLYCPYYFSKDRIEKMISSISFPSKLVTYLSTEVPVLLHAPSYSSPFRFLSKNNCAYLLDTNDPNKIVQYILENIKDEKQKKIISNIKKVYEENFSLEVCKKHFFNALNIKYTERKKLRILEVNNVDLPGRRFNGYDLLNEINNNSEHIAKQIVTYKTSKNKNVLKFYPNQDAISEEWKLLELEKKELSVHSQLSYTTNILKQNDFFRNSDLVHYHLIHNTKLSLYEMIDLCKMRPSILTLHDPWIFTGRCAYNQECDDWLNGCKDCKFLDNLFSFNEDNCHSMWKLKQKIYKELDIDIVVSTPFMLDMLNRSPLTKHFKNVHIIPFGVDLSKFKGNEEKEQSRIELNIPNDDIVFFFRSQMAMKGTEFIVEAMNMLDTDVNITLLSCDEIGNLESLKDKYNVIELGHIGDELMVKALNACDVFLMPSRGESFGLMTIEAMAAGRPVVIFNNTASPSVAFAPDCGILVENKNSKKLMEAIDWISKDEKERIKRGKLARKLAEKHYDINTYHDRIMKLYYDAYERQKNKENIISNININYNEKDSQMILLKLNKIWNKLNMTISFTKYFPKFDDNNPNIEFIDYSSFSVQEIIKIFNKAIYREKKSKFTFFNDIKPLQIGKLRKKDLISIILMQNKIFKPIHFLLKIFYNIARFFYKILKKIYNKISLKNKLISLTNRVNSLEFELHNSMKYSESLENKISDVDKNELISLTNRVNSLEFELHNSMKYSESLENKISDVDKNELLISLKNELDLYKDKFNYAEKEIGSKFSEINNNISNSPVINDIKAKIIGRVKNIFYYHGGSGNHGCEALIKTIAYLSKIETDNSIVCSYVAKEDYKFNVDSYFKYILDSNQDTEELNGLFFDDSAIAYSIGGDNYCGYDYGTKRLEKYNTFFNDRKIKTALIGCSIEPEILNHQEVLDDLHNFSLITARESITYEALISKGINRNTHLIPDSAFILEPTFLPLPKGFEENNTIGINVSNMVQNYDNKPNMTLNNYKKLIEYILKQTNYSVALIPHVIQLHNDDLSTLKMLYDFFKDSNRVVLLTEHSASELKGFIKRCKMLVCTRTHASIAGYSSLVPTLVLGYSVKSKGIAYDIFGTSKNYVLPVDSLKTYDDLTHAFLWLEKNYDMIKNNLEKIMPKYTSNCYKLTKRIDELKQTKYNKKKLPNEYNCTGCLTCVEVCPQKCIEPSTSTKGFISPKVNYNLCVECDTCRVMCPVNTEKNQNINIDFYAIKNTDSFIRSISSSGGVFYSFAKSVIGRNGLVFGAYLDNDMKLYQISVDNINDLKKIMKSKYLQSDTKKTYKECETLLKNGKEVLYCGTPCQISGLKNYLGKEYTKLICLDFVCHGVPSQKEFDKHVKYLEEKYNKKVINIDFRDKLESWMEFNVRIYFSDGTSILESKSENNYIHNFLSNLTLRNSCYNCNFNNFKNYSDITIGDLWSCKEKLIEEFDDKGISLVITNTKKGREFLKENNSELSVKKITKEVALYSNYSILNSVDLPVEREKYFSEK